MILKKYFRTSALNIYKYLLFFALDYEPYNVHFGFPEMTLDRQKLKVSLTQDRFRLITFCYCSFLELELWNQVGPRRNLTQHFTNRSSE